MFDLGDPVPLSVEIRDATGVLAAASPAPVLTVTLPDGTSATPTVTTPSTGVYVATYSTTQAGRHAVRWVAVGTNASAYTDAFDVDEAAPTGIVSLAEAKAHLNMTSTTNDEELRRYIDAATDFVESRIGPVVKRSITTLPLWPIGGRLFLDGPVVSLTTIVSALGYTATYSAASYTMVGDEIVPNLGATCFYGPVVVTYLAGRTVVPAGIRQAALDYVKWLWDTQRGASAAPFQGGASEFAVTAPSTVPYRILQALEPFTVSVVA